jgi:hypothetical protein
MRVARVLAATAAASLAGLTSALSPLTIKGSKFFNPDGSQFFVKGWYLS